MDNVIPLVPLEWWWKRPGTGVRGVSTAAATSALSDGDSSNPVVNQLKISKKY